MPKPVDAGTKVKQLLKDGKSGHRIRLNEDSSFLFKEITSYQKAEGTVALVVLNNLP